MTRMLGATEARARGVVEALLTDPLPGLKLTLFKVTYVSFRHEEEIETFRSEAEDG